MPHAITKLVWNFDELEERAKDKAREWYRQGALDYEWYDSSFEDFEHVAALLGIEFDRKPGRRLDGTSTPGNPMIYFSGFASQGDGACFEGRWNHKAGVGAAIRDYAPTDATLHSIADELEAAAGLEAKVTHTGRYYHAHSTTIDVFETESDNDAPELLAIGLRDTLRDFMNWMYRQLEAEHDYLLSDENVDESIRTNEYEFTREGRRACV